MPPFESRATRSTPVQRRPAHRPALLRGPEPDGEAAGHNAPVLAPARTGGLAADAGRAEEGGAPVLEHRGGRGGRQLAYDERASLALRELALHGDAGRRLLRPGGRRAGENED